MLHSLLKLWCKVSLHFFFRKWQVQFHSQLPNAPTIFLANHPNAFLDAILIARSIQQKPWFLARGEVFKSKWSAWILSKLRLIPIFRFRDGHGLLRKNEDIINSCAELLKRGESIILFPEGENSTQYNLLPLQKGFIKIAEAVLKVNSNLNLQIVPVGIQYSLETKGFGGTALVNFGKPINFPEFSKDKSTEQILNLMWERMDVLIAKKENLVYVPRKPNWLHQVNSIYFSINNFVLKSLIRLIVSRIKEEQMKNSVRFAAGLFLVPPIYLIQTALTWCLTNSWIVTIGYLISLPVSVRLKLL